MSNRAPSTLLKNAIVERLKNDPRWTWTIWQCDGGNDQSPGNNYLVIDSGLRPIKEPGKNYFDIRYPIAFDAYEVEPEMIGLLSENTVYEMLDTMENIITLNQYKDNFLPFDFTGKRDCMKDYSHVNDTPAFTMMQNKNMVHARQIIEFRLSYIPGSGA